MFKKLALLSFTFFALTITSSAQAFYVEPYIGMGFGVGDSSGEQVVAGARGGVSVGPMLSLGAQANYFFDGESFTAGPVVKLDAPIISAWAGYNLLGDESGGFDYDGGPFVGVGFSVFPMISLNAEYHRNEFSSGGTDLAVETLMVTLSTSLP